MLDRIRRWGQLGLEFMLGQGIVQAAGMLSGLIYVRLMPVEEYAVYALCLGMLGLVSLGSDLGLTGSLSYFWRESAKAGGTIDDKIAAVRALRTILLSISLAVCAIMLLATASRLSMTSATTLGVFLILAATAWSNARLSADLHVMRLKGNLRAAYVCDASGSMTRLLAAVLLLLAGLTSAPLGLAGGLVGSVVALAVLHAAGQGYRGRRDAVSAATWSELRAYILPMLPGVLVFMAQEPLILWLTAIFGGATPTSEAFAVGRIGAVFALVGQFVVMVVTPRLAGIGDDAHFVRMAGIVAASLLVLGAASLLLCAFAPWLPLLLIGPRYERLQHEVLIVTATAAVSTLTMLIVLCNRVRGWVRLDPLIALIQLTAIVALSLSWSYASAASVLTLSLLLSIVSLIGSLTITICGLRWPDLARSKPAGVGVRD